MNLGGKRAEILMSSTLSHVDSLSSAPTSNHLHLILFKEKIGSFTPVVLTIVRSQIMTREDDTCTQLKQGLRSFKSIYPQFLGNSVNFI